MPSCGSARRWKSCRTGCRRCGRTACSCAGPIWRCRRSSGAWGRDVPGPPRATGGEGRAAMNAIVECVPNFSEGRRREIVDALVQSFASVPGVVFLDAELDADHNRSVVTFAGEPDAVIEAAVRAVACARDRIDVNHHTGQHPRMGAADVVPFVPVEGVTLEDCAELARACGRRIGEELGIPVFLYEAAASRPDRVSLADVRRGQFEGLRES